MPSYEKELEGIDCFQVITWDWKASINMQKVKSAQKAGRIYLTEVEDTGQDCYACVMTQMPITEEQAQLLFELYSGDDPYTYQWEECDKDSCWRRVGREPVTFEYCSACGHLADKCEC